MDPIVLRQYVTRGKYDVQDLRRKLPTPRLFFQQVTKKSSNNVGNTKNVIKVFKAHGLQASKIGKTGGEYIQLNKTIKVKVREARHRWENGLREKL